MYTDYYRFGKLISVNGGDQRKLSVSDTVHFPDDHPVFRYPNESGVGAVSFRMILYKSIS